MSPASLAVPATFFGSAVLVGGRTPLRRAAIAATVAVALALTTLPGAGVVRGSMLALVGWLALVITRYARRQLDGDPGSERFARALLATFGCVTLLVVSDHLVVIALAWMGTSLALHHLLTHFQDRLQARIAAHKKFLLSRLADACVLGAVGIIGRVTATLDVEQVDAWARQHDALPAWLQVATVLLAFGVLLKSAQLPFHGWLTQVMEAPTPVSALLHAGVVNVGGFVLIRLAPLMERATIARGLLVVVGLGTAIVAALVTTTRVSVKVALAWSTIAQMGFMLVQCGLGAWHLALLHLVAHSLYKAHAFLSAGTTVATWRDGALAGTPPTLRPRHVLVGAGTSLAVIGSVVAAGASVDRALIDGALAPLAVLLAIALVSPVARAAAYGWRPLASVLVRALGATLGYLGWHHVFGRGIPPTSSSLGWYAVAVAFAALLFLQLTMQLKPDGALARALQPRLFAGLYLDEIFTRLTFRVWPPRRSAAPPTTRRWTSEPAEVRS